MTSSPLISVIIPVFNNEKYIIEALDSVLQDVYQNKEIVLINDGSTDNNHALIQDWIARHSSQIFVNYLYRENRGITKTLNELVSRCQGDYIAYFCSDDILSPNSLTDRYEYLIQNPSKLAVFADCQVIDQEGRFLHESAYTDFHKVNKEKFKTDPSLKEQIVKNFAVPGPVLMVKKEVYDIVGPYNEAICYEDWDFYLRLVSKNLLGFLDKNVCQYRVHPLNTCRSKAVINITRDNRKIILKAMQGLSDYKHYFLKLLIYNEIYLIYLNIKFLLLDNSDKSIYSLFLSGLLFLKGLCKKYGFVRQKSY